GLSHGVTREIWQSITGSYVFNLTSSSEFEGTPNIKDTITHFERQSIGDDYGQRMTTFYRAPETGLFVFYMTCQDECELWLSTDDTNFNKRRIIFVPFGLNLTWKQWDKKAEQVSSPINLVSGEFYFMEAIMKADSNPSDHLGVGVRQPNGNKYQPILNPDLYSEIPERKIALFLLVQRDASLVGHVMSTTALDNDVACSLYCTRDRNCKSFNYYREQGICELNKEKTANNIKGVLVPYRGAEYYEKMEPNQ
ncbi:unnamed protein product, partial [Porites evermanni]